jgi:glycosyltransferase involved in cell wall biosynthesis
MGRVLLIRQGHVPYDPRVRRDLDALVREGHHVDVISKRIPGRPTFERLPHVTIRRLWTYERRGGRLGYLFRYGAFMVMATWLAAWLHLRHRYQVVQVHSLPDTLVFAALVPRLLGARVVLDLQEPMPEFFASKFRLGMEHRGVRLLGALEQAAIRFADHVLTCTNEMRAAFVRRGAPPRKVTVLLNAADEDVFDVRRFPPRARREGRFELVCHGTIEDRYGHDTVVRAMAALRDQLPELRLRVFGDGSYREGLRALVAELGLEDRVWFSDGFVPVDEMVAGIADADVGVVAMKRDVFRDLTHCNKMFDFIAMRRPQIVSRTAAVESCFDDGCFEMFRSGDVDDLARAVRRLHDSPERARRLVERARVVCEPYRWPGQREIYLEAVRSLLGPRLRVAERPAPAPTLAEDARPEDAA